MVALPIGELVIIVNFQTRFLDVSSQSTVTQTPNTGSGAQDWIIRNTSTGIQIQNDVAGFLGAAGGIIPFGLAVQESTSPLNFNAVPIGSKFMFVEKTTGFALTSWPTQQDVGTLAPVTFYPAVNATEQLWIVDLD